MNAAAGGRRVIDGILHRVRTGVQWRDPPERFGPWKTVYKRRRLWSADGTWERLLQRVQAEADAAGGIDWDVSVDSTIVRAHQRAAGARTDPPPVPKGDSAVRTARSSGWTARPRAWTWMYCGRTTSRSRPTTTRRRGKSLVARLVEVVLEARARAARAAGSRPNSTFRPAGRPVAVRTGRPAGAARPS